VTRGEGGANSEGVLPTLWMQNALDCLRTHVPVGSERISNDPPNSCPRSRWFEMEPGQP
jgi:hypothetical protein